MRLFVSLDIPEEISEYLEEVSSKLPHYGIKKVHDFHLTLKFLGEIDDSKVSDVVKCLKSVKFNSFKLKLSEIGYFPNRSRLDSVWIGVEPLDELKRLQESVESALSSFGVVNDHPFKAHITLCRIKYLKNTKFFIDKVNNIKLEKKSFLVSGFKLMKSTLTPEGPIYEDVEEYFLE
ncbi:MAG: RNA 2',3'-cyclic phosphodiesterase [Candidatus Woesearchaeota archaeon]